MEVTVRIFSNDVGSVVTFICKICTYEYTNEITILQYAPLLYPSNCNNCMYDVRKLTIKMDIILYIIIIYFMENKL